MDSHRQGKDQIFIIHGRLKPSATAQDKSTLIPRQAPGDNIHPLSQMGHCTKRSVTNTDDASIYCYFWQKRENI